MPGNEADNQFNNTDDDKKKKLNKLFKRQSSANGENANDAAPEGENPENAQDAEGTDAQDQSEDNVDTSNDSVPESTGGETSDGQSDGSDVSDPLSQVDDDELANYIMELLRKDTNDKEQTGLIAEWEYGVNSYEGNRQPTNFPWVNCSNFSVPLTPALLDTAHANVLGSIFADPENTTDVQGVGVEDIRKAPQLSQLLNWQVNTELEADEVWNKACFRALQSGTAPVKVTQSFFDNKVVLNSIPAENIYLPLDATGFQVNETDHVFEVIPLTYNEIQARRKITDPKTGKSVYEGIEDIGPGLRVVGSTAIDTVTRTKDTVSNTKLSDRQTRDLYYLMECYLTYYPKSQDPDVVNDPVELIVTMAPTGRKVLRKVVNKYKVRPYFAIIPYPRDDRFWGRSLPGIIRDIQEELDYAHNQNINAADIVISPPLFYDPTTGFDPNIHQITPGGSYPSNGGKAPEYAQRDLNAIFERQEDRYWDLAERRTGLTELFQGRTPSKTKTLGEAKLRNNRTEIRFKALYSRFEKAWSEMIKLVYFYDTLYMPKDKKIKVIGVNDYKRIDELFPEGLEGQFNFTFKSAPITEIELKKQTTKEMCEKLFELPIVNADVGNQWKVLKKYTEAMGERNTEVLVTKPQQANIISPEEAIQRIMSGQYDLVPEPGIDPQNYMLRIQLFMLTDTFRNAKPEAKQSFMLLLRRVQNIAVGQLKGKMDAMILQHGAANGGVYPAAQLQQQAGQQPPPSNGGVQQQ